jgi:hypothetical protein
MFTLGARFEIDADPKQLLRVHPLDATGFAGWIAEVPGIAGCVAAVASDAAPTLVRAFRI